jgi:hypothetical protein
MAQLFLTKLHAVHDRHHQVEQDGTRSQATVELIEGFAAVLGGLHRKPLGAEECVKALANIRMVVDHEYDRTHM